MECKTRQTNKMIAYGIVTLQNVLKNVANDQKNDDILSFLQHFQHFRRSLNDLMIQIEFVAHTPTTWKTFYS